MDRALARVDDNDVADCRVRGGLRRCPGRRGGRLRSADVVAPLTERRQRSFRAIRDRATPAHERDSYAATNGTNPRTSHVAPHRTYVLPSPAPRPGALVARPGAGRDRRGAGARRRLRQHAAGSRTPTRRPRTTRSRATSRSVTATKRGSSSPTSPRTAPPSTRTCRRWRTPTGCSRSSRRVVSQGGHVAIVADHDRQRRQRPPEADRQATSRTSPRRSVTPGVDVEFSGDWFGDAVDARQ